MPLVSRAVGRQRLVTAASPVVVREGISLCRWRWEDRLGVAGVWSVVVVCNGIARYRHGHFCKPAVGKVALGIPIGLSNGGWKSRT